MAARTQAEYVGPYHGTAYDIADRWVANGGQQYSVGPYSGGMYDIAERIMGAQPGAGGPQQVHTGAPTGGSGQEGPVLNRAALDATQRAIDSLGTERRVGLGNIRDNYQSLIGGYDAERDRYRGEFDENVTTNKQNLAKNKQAALLSAAQGRRGLRGTLSALGALGGDGGVMADRAVTHTANQDIGEASGNYATNAQGLDRAWSNFEDEDDQRRRAAATARTNQRSALDGRILDKRQGFYNKKADIYAEGGRDDDASRYLRRAGDLNEAIAQAGRVEATPFQRQNAAFTPGSLQDYLAGAGDMTVDVRQGGQGGQQQGQPSIFARLRGNRQQDEEREA